MGAQEAHEAIRPTDFTKAPDKVGRYLEPDALKLYKLIWQRTLASQASSAEIERTTADIDVAGSDGKPYGVRATGSVIRFDGFLKIYEEGVDDAVGEDGSLPALVQGEPLRSRAIEAKQHFTEPPPRYSEATLIKKMEELGYVRRIERKAKVGDNLPNEYDLRGLVKAASKLADEKIALRAKRAAEDKSRRVAPAAFALIDGGKKD